MQYFVRFITALIVLIGMWTFSYYASKSIILFDDPQTALFCGFVVGIISTLTALVLDMCINIYRMQREYLKGAPEQDYES